MTEDIEQAYADYLVIVNADNSVTKETKAAVAAHIKSFVKFVEARENIVETPEEQPLELLPVEHVS